MTRMGCGKCRNMLAKADHLVGLQNHCCAKRWKLPWQLEAFSADECLQSVVFSIFWVLETFAVIKYRQTEKPVFPLMQTDILFPIIQC